MTVATASSVMSQRDCYEVQKEFFLLTQTCSTGLTSLTSSSFFEKNASVGNVETYYSDFQSLLSVLYSSITKLGLVLKPSNPTYNAALTVLKDIRAYTGALASCACSVEVELHGQAFVKELRWATEDIINSLQSLITYFGSDRKEGKEYIVRIGVVHEAIDRARRISHSNNEAVKKIWEANLGGLEDGVKELQDLTEDEIDEAPLSDDSGSDMGFLNLSESKTELTGEELKRIKTIQQLLEMTISMNRRIISLLEGQTFHWQTHSKLSANSLLDQAVFHSSALLATSDDLISALYHPQDQSSIINELYNFKSHISNIENELARLGILDEKDLENELTRPMLSLTVADSTLKKSDVDIELQKERDWFSSYFVKIHQACNAIICDNDFESKP